MEVKRKFIYLLTVRNNLVIEERIVRQGKDARLVLANNITIRLDYLKALEIQNKKLREIAWTQSHVVRAPLARIMGLINTIKDNLELDDENIAMLGHLLSSAVELDDIVREIPKKAEEARMEIKD